MHVFLVNSPLHDEIQSDGECHENFVNPRSMTIDQHLHCHVSDMMEGLGGCWALTNSFQVW